MTITIETQNNSDARRIGSREIRIPRCASQRHLGGKRVRIMTDDADLEAVVAWLEARHEVASYEIL